MKMHEYIYRPQQKDEQQLIDDFVIRIQEFNKLMDSIKTDQPGKIPQHILIQGVRGMGKTTLMQRVEYELKRHFGESGIVPVKFNEESYRIRALYKFWEQLIRHLEDSEPVYSGIWQRMKELSGAEGDDQAYEEACFQLIKTQTEKHDHRLVLLIDNFGVMLGKFTRQDQQRLREVLMDFPRLKIIGGSAVTLESFFQHDKPFFEFFKVMHLEKLDRKEIHTLLSSLGKKHHAAEIEKILKEQPGRVESLRILTNGVPRTVVMLFDIFLDNQKGDSIQDLHRLVDLVTPLYQHRMDNLPAQQQEIVEVLALNWDGMSVSELVKATRMESRAISAQLTSLRRSGIINATKSTGKNMFYQLEERFFNIWFLMQQAPRAYQKKVIWLTRFLEVWCDGDSLDHNIGAFIQRIQKEKLNEEYVKTMVYAYSQVKGVSEKQRDTLIQSAKKSLEQTFSLEELPLEQKEFTRKFSCFIASENFNDAKGLIDKASFSKEKADFLYVVVDFIKLHREKEIRLIKKNENILFSMGYIFDEILCEYKISEKYYHNSYKLGYKDASLSLAKLYHERLNQPKKAQKFLLQASKNGVPGVIPFMVKFYSSKGQNKDNLINIIDFTLNFLEYNNSGEDYKSAISILINFSVIGNITYVKQEVENYARVIERDYSSKYVTTFILYLIWTDKFDEASIKIKDYISVNYNSNNDQILDGVIKIAFAKGMRQFVVKLFNKDEYHLKDRFKVLYYAIMTLMQDEYPNEIRKMGKELEEPVSKMVEELQQMEEKYKS